MALAEELERLNLLPSGRQPVTLAWKPNAMLFSAAKARIEDLQQDLQHDHRGCPWKALGSRASNPG